MKPLKDGERLLTRLSLLPAVIPNVGHVVIFHVFLYLLQSRALELRFEISGDVVVDAQVQRLSLHGLTSGPAEYGEHDVD